MNDKISRDSNSEFNRAFLDSQLDFRVGFSKSIPRWILKIHPAMDLENPFRIGFSKFIPRWILKIRSALDSGNLVLTSLPDPPIPSLLLSPAPWIDRGMGRGI